MDIKIDDDDTRLESYIEGIIHELKNEDNNEDKNEDKNEDIGDIDDHSDKIWGTSLDHSKVKLVMTHDK